MIGCHFRIHRTGEYLEAIEPTAETSFGAAFNFTKEQRARCHLEEANGGASPAIKDEAIVVELDFITATSDLEREV